MTIVTFGCSKAVHIYHEGCGYSPMHPFKTHQTKEAAIAYLKKRGVKRPKFEINERIIRDDD